MVRAEWWRGGFGGGGMRVRGGCEWVWVQVESGGCVGQWATASSVGGKQGRHGSERTKSLHQTDACPSERLQLPSGTPRWKAEVRMQRAHYILQLDVKLPIESQVENVFTARRF